MVREVELWKIENWWSRSLWCLSWSVCLCTIPTPGY